MDLAQVRRFWQGEDRVMVSLYATEHEYRERFDDEELLSSASLQLEAQARLHTVKDQR